MSALIQAATGSCTGIVKLLLSHPKIKVNLIESEGWKATLTVCDGALAGVETSDESVFAHLNLDIDAVEKKKGGQPWIFATMKQS